jgi:NAD+ synthase (glutamine-hydrolysing)
LGVLQDVTKLKVYELARRIPAIPQAILEKVPSAELRENQTDLDTLPPFEILDPILEDYLEERLSPEEIAEKRKQPIALVIHIIQTIHRNEYKRRQTPIGLRVTKKAFSKGRIVPIVQKWH